MRHPPQDQIIPEQEHASTGMTGLDHRLGGGLPANQRRVENGEAGLYITLSETAVELVLSGVAYKGALPLLSDTAARAS